jgi:hypothetical protein
MKYFKVQTPKTDLVIIYKRFPSNRYRVASILPTTINDIMRVDMWSEMLNTDGHEKFPTFVTELSEAEAFLELV